MFDRRERQFGQGTLGDELRAREGRLFVGREAERALFLRLLLDNSQPKGVLNVFGMDGAGKTSLLSEFRRLADHVGCGCLAIDGRDIPRPPERYAEKVLAVRSSEQPAAITIDSFECLGDLEDWVIYDFLPRLPARFLVVIAGRHSLQGTWRTSPEWRPLIKYLPLGNFDLSLTREYLHRHKIADEAVIGEVWTYTQGNPLAVSLAAALLSEGAGSGLGARWNGEAIHVLARNWLSEVPDENLRLLVESASVIRRFDQEIIGYLTGQPVDPGEFARLVSLSFVHLERDGWAMHDLVRKVISAELRWRSPARFDSMWRRSLSWYREIIMAKPGAAGKTAATTELFYLLGDAMIRSAFFADQNVEELIVEPVSSNDLPLITDFLNRWSQSCREAGPSLRTGYLDYEKGVSIEHIVSSEIVAKEIEIFNPAEWIKLAPGVIRACKTRAGEIKGISVAVPVNRLTLDFLSVQPVTGAYFRSLAPDELAEYARSEEKAVWFIRLLGVSDQTDNAVRAALMRNLLPLMFQADVVLASTPMIFYKELLGRLGFKEVPQAAHFDYGPGFPSTTYCLDLRGPLRARYLDTLTDNIGGAAVPICPVGLELTKREAEVAQMVVAGLSNSDIAATLCVSQVTVKKHLTSIFSKTKCANRAQLVRRLLTNGNS